MLKRVSCHLYNLKKIVKGFSRKGKVTIVMIDRLQNYYGIAISQNKKQLKEYADSSKGNIILCCLIKGE